MSLNWDTYNTQSEDGVTELLTDLGHFIGTDDRAEAISSYQDYSGLKQTGKWTSAESDRLRDRFCNCPDISHQNTRKGHWEFGANEPKVIKLWSNVAGANDTFVQNWMVGAKWWTQGIDLDFEFVANQRDSHIWARLQFIDGLNRTLAWSMLPVAHQRYRSRWLEQRYDPRDMNSVARIQRVSAHEIGHALGIDHIPASVGTNLMNPFDNPRIRTILAGDLAEAVERYGVRDTNPTPPNPREETPCEKRERLLREAKAKLVTAQSDYEKALSAIESQV